ncbi:MAG: S26 family signal peptidase, partial [Clostridia bacterium]|nr:S26 family signal peptidase [Clostridia bacterium]
MEPTHTIKKIVKIAANILLYLFIAVCIFSVILTISSKKDIDGTATIFGTQMRSVLTSSMEKCDATDVSGFEIKDIPAGSMIFVDVVPEDPEKAQEWYADLKVGDVLTFKYVYVRQETITHRIVDIQPNQDGGYTINLEGDNKGTDSATLAQTINTAT